MDKSEQVSIPRDTIAVLKKYNITAQKRYGQNFLIDPHVLKKIVDAAEIGPEDAVLEIGPGIGTLTRALAGRAAKVIAVEIDKGLIPVLEEELSGCGNVTFICGDILKQDVPALLAAHGEGRTVKVVANLPYYITTPIIMGLLEGGAPIESMTVMVQREVARRMQAGPGTKDYGALSLAVQYYAEVYIAANVPANCFLPRPGVDSAVIRLTKRKVAPVACPDPEEMFAIIKAAFGQRRKRLVNALFHSGELSFTKEEILDALRREGLGDDVRGEMLSLAEFAGLAGRLSKKSDPV